MRIMISLETIKQVVKFSCSTPQTLQQLVVCVAMTWNNDHRKSESFIPTLLYLFP